MALRGIEPRSRPRQGRILATGLQGPTLFNSKKYLKSLFYFFRYGKEWTI